MQTSFIKDVVGVFSVAALCLVICRRFHLPTLIGFLIAGISVGPFGLNLIDTPEKVHLLAEFGVVLLLFTLGIEFSFQKFLRIKRIVLWGGFGQVALCVFCTFLLLWACGQPPNRALFFGFLLSLSSTAIVLKLLQERQQIDTPQGKASLGLLIFQDMIVILFMLLTPVLSGSESWQSFLLPFGLSLLLIVGTLLVSVWVVPVVLHRVMLTRSSELFVLSIILICLGIAYWTSRFGLSLGIGAFLAGLAISESEYHHQALEVVIPFRDIFLSFFFISVGMLLDLNFLFSNLLSIALLAVGIMLLKILLILAVTLSLRLSVRNCVQTALFTCQVGEFAFVLAKEGFQREILPEPAYQIFLAVSVFTMALTPWIVQVAPNIATSIARLKIAQDWDQRVGQALQSQSSDAPATKVHQGHLVVIGYGLTGRCLVESLQKVGLSDYLVLEMNPETVRRERSSGKPIYFGDATNHETLHSLNIAQAKLVLVAISDQLALPLIIRNVRSLNPQVPLIVRSRFLSENEALRAVGANEIVCEETESLLEIIHRVLDGHCQVETSQQKELLDELRAKIG